MGISPPLPLKPTLLLTQQRNMKMVWVAIRAVFHAWHVPLKILLPLGSP